MIIKSFRIYNYKSIHDSGNTYLANNLTIFAGKNESGKTNILEALEHFNVDKEFNEQHIPIQTQKKPKIEITFKIKRDELPTYKKIEDVLEIPQKDEFEIQLIKEYPKKYYLDSDSLKLLGLAKNKESRIEQRDAIRKHYEELKKVHVTKIPKQTNLNLPDIPFLNIEEAEKKLQSYISSLNSNNKISNDVRNELAGKSKDLISYIKAHEDDVHDLEYARELAEYVPYFVFFRSFDDILPNQIQFNDFSENQWIKAFNKISDLNPELITSSNNRAKTTHKKKLNLEINDEFRKYWKQDKSNLYVDWDNNSLFFWIEEDNQYFEPSIRSKGKQWYLSFYILVSARIKGTREFIILIDEPGLYLHAKAQNDILSRLESLASKNSPILFSTHSPYLIKHNKLNRVKAVIKEENKSRIENKLHKVSDQETLTPILTTIGLGVNDGIHNLDKVNNVVVEGPSDYFYLNAFLKVNNSPSFNVIHGGGSTNMPHVGTILQGWNCKVFYLFDNDTGYKQAKSNISKYWECTTKEMIGKIPIDNASIEDVLSKEDYHKYILKSDTEDKRKKNSNIAKEKGRDKVLDSKLFFEEILSDKIDLDSESKKNIQILLKLFEEKFKE